MYGRRALFGLLVLSFIVSSNAIRFYLNPGIRRCFTEELPTDSKITGELNIATGKGDMEVDLWITTVQGKVLFNRRSTTHGKFSFRTPRIEGHQEDPDDYDYLDEPEEDTFKICIEHQQSAGQAHPRGTNRAIYFHVNEAFSQEPHSLENKMAKASDTDRLQSTMRTMHTTLSGMIGDLSQLQRRERLLTAKMEMTTSLVTRLAIFSFIVAIGTSALQFHYYKRYFKQKKLC